MRLAHRGSRPCLENSMAAFRRALLDGFDGVEVDVRLTADRVPVIMHDASLERTTVGDGTLGQVRHHDLPFLKNGERIPLLSEVLALPFRCVNVELKDTWAEPLEVVVREGALDRVLFSSFDHSQIFGLSRACPAARCGLLWHLEEARALHNEQLDKIPAHISLHVPVGAVTERPDMWRPYQDRLVLWSMRDGEAGGLVEARIYIVD